MPSNDRVRLTPGHGVHHHSSLWRRSRSNVNMHEEAAPPPGPTPSLDTVPTKIVPYIKPPGKLERAPSKMSLFNLFSKPKVEKARGHTEVGLAVPLQPEEPKPRPSPPKSALRHNPPPHAQQAQRMRSNQTLRPISITTPPPTRRPVSMIEEDWVPPPLFQAYPQSIKYATVQACAFSPDVLLRSQSQRKQAELLREKMNSRRDLAESLEGASEHKKLEKAHKRLVSNSMVESAPQLTNKIYVLVTAGYVLQYAGEGPFDRLPEKVLKLGNESAAFACDLIPGKHWVLQISQSASEDGTVITAPKHSLFSRFRTHNNVARKAATSFLLVMESAEEMESWMTTVRREIEKLGGMKVSEESSRASGTSSSIDETSEKKSVEVPSHRYLASRNPHRVSSAKPVDSPLQSQYSDSPKIVTSEWEGNRSERTLSIADSVSLHSRYSTHRRSVGASSISTTVTSHAQLDLDQLRERGRNSYVSTTTSISGTGTRNTSRNSSPAPTSRNSSLAPTSPFREGLSSTATAAVPNAEIEPRRSATSLKSFHMSPGNMTMRRRSMQPLPVTNEDSSSSAAAATPQRHSIYGPISPTFHEAEKRDVNDKLAPTPAALINAAPAAATRPAENARYSLIRLQDRQPSNPNLVRYNARSSSAPDTRNSAAPSPHPPAPTIGHSPTSAAQPNHSERRVSATPKPFLRPFPVRPQPQQNADGSMVIPRRLSMAASRGPAPLPLGIVINRSVTAPTQTLPTISTTNPRRQSVQQNKSFQVSPTAQQLRRPNSVQIRSNPAPFLSHSRPVRAVSSTPSFVQGRRGSVSSPASTATATPTTTSIVPASFSTPSTQAPSTVRSDPSSAFRPNPAATPPTRHVLRGQGQQLTPPKNQLASRRSVPNMNMRLPPPAPPPNMPLPATPNAHRGVVV